VQVNPVAQSEFLLSLDSVISSKSKNPALAVKWVDFSYTPEASQWVLYGGREGIEWDWSTEPSVTGNNRSFKPLLDVMPKTWGVWVWPTVTTFENYLDVQPAASPVMKQDYEASLMYKQYAVYTKIPQLSWTADEDLLVEYGEINGQVGDYINTNRVQFIVGVNDVMDDNVWQEYINGLYARGFERWLELSSEYYFGG
jgi:hypothetical protein